MIYEPWEEGCNFVCYYTVGPNAWIVPCDAALGDNWPSDCNQSFSFWLGIDGDPDA